MKYLFFFLPAFVFFSCNNKKQENSKEEQKKISTPADTVATTTEALNLPEPNATKSVKNYSKVMGWENGTQPTAVQGFVVTKFADSLDNPRWIYQAPNDDIFVAEANTPHSTLEKITGQKKSANRITMFRDANKDGKPELRSVFAENLNLPFGMLVIGNNFYVANTDGIMQFPYTGGSTALNGAGKKILSLPGGPRHWTRNIIANQDGSKIYVAVGSSTDHAENGIDKETRRANIIEINPDGTGERIYASGIRNPVGMGWAPGTNMLWAAVNERDELGDDLVPDYLTSVKDGGFYGWPYSYYGKHIDPRVKDSKQDMIDKAIVPDVPLGSHTASLGLAFYNQKAFPAMYQNGAFIAQHGSWNRSVFSGYKVVFVPFSNGKPSGKPQDFLTGFIADNEKSQVFGRPVGIAVLHDGSILVADDAGNTIWRVAVAK